MPSLKNMPYPYYSPPPAPPPPPSPPPCNPPPPPPPCKEKIPPPPPPPPHSKHCHHKHCGHHHHHPPNGASPPTPSSNPTSPPVSPPSHHPPKSHAPTTPPQTPTYLPKVPPHGPFAPPKPTPGSPHCPPSPVPKPSGHKKPSKPKSPAYPPKTPSHPPKTPPVSPVAPPKMLPGSPYPPSPAPKPGGPIKAPKPSSPAYPPKTSSTPPTTLPGSPHYSPSSAPKPNGPSQPPKPFTPAYPPNKTRSGLALPPNTSPESSHYPPSFMPNPSRPVKPPKPSPPTYPPNTPPGGPRAPPPTSSRSPIYPPHYPISDALMPLPSNNSVRSPPSGNHHTTVIAVCASLGGFFFLTFLAAGLFRLGKTKKIIRVPAVAKQAIGVFFGVEGDPAPDGGGGEISEDSKDKPFDLSTVRNHSFQRRLGDGDQGSSRQPLGRPPPTELAALSHRPASKGPSTSKVRSGSPAGKQAWEHMKDAMNPNDSGTPGDYTSDQLLDLGAGDPVSQEVDKRWFDENGKSKEELAQRPSRRDFPKEKYNPDAKHRRRPPASAARKNQTEKPRADVVSRFKDSDKFKNALMDAAADIYEQTVQECRRILQETGRVAEEDLLLMDPNLPMNFNAQGVTEDAGDVEDDNEDDISPLP